MAERADELANAGEISRTEADLARLDFLALARDIQRYEGEVELARLALAKAMGLAPSVEFEPAPITLELPKGEPSLVDHPRLALCRTRYARAEAELARAVRQQFPALTLGPALEEDEGRTKIGGMLGWRLPLSNRNRVAIDRARVERELARVACELEYEALVGELAEARVQFRVSHGSMVQLRGVELPLFRKGLRAVEESMEQGEASVLVALEHHRRHYEAIRMSLTETTARERATARLIGLIGSEGSEE